MGMHEWHIIDDIDVSDYKLASVKSQDITLTTPSEITL